MRDPVKTVGNMLDRQSVVYFASLDAEGCPAVTAMLAPRLREGIKRFLFTTNLSSRKCANILADAKASFYFADKRFFRGVLLTGRARVVTDPEVKAAVWRAGDERYYPEGVQDPDYCVIELIAQKGRYYADFKSEDFVIE